MKILSLLFLSTFFVQSVQAAAPAVSEYAFEQKISTAFDTEKSVEVLLNSKVVRENDTDFSRLQLVNANNEPVEFTLFDIPAKPVDLINSFKVSSFREDASPRNLLDNNRLTVFSFDEKIDGSNPSIIWIDFGRIIKLHRIELWPTSTANIPGYEIRGGTRENKIKTIKRKTAFQSHTDVNFPPLRYLEVKLWGNNIHLEDMNLYQKAEASIFFQATAKERYKILYGNPLVDSKRYLKRISEKQVSKTVATTHKASFNPLFVTDADKDGVENTADNCPFISNKKQKDKDTDMIGDECDNAPAVKNYAQSDVDLDGVGDIVDNCKLKPNTSQLDRDSDGVGNACDTNPQNEKITLSVGDTSVSVNKIWLGVLFVMVLGIIGFVTYKRKKK